MSSRPYSPTGTPTPPPDPITPRPPLRRPSASTSRLPSVPTNDIVARTFSVDEVRADVVRIDYFRVMDRLSVTDILERFGRRMVFVGNIHNWNIWELLVEELSEG